MLKKRESEQTNTKYILLLRHYHTIMYLGVAIFFTMFGWAMHKHYPDFALFPFIVSGIEFVSTNILESLGGVGSGGMLIYIFKKWIDKKMAKEKK